MVTTNEIRILSLWQPWASLVSLNLKQYETRSWYTPYRGKIAIHAAKRPQTSAELNLLHDVVCLTDATIRPADLPLGAIVAIADLVDCLGMVSPESFEKSTQICLEQVSILEVLVGDWSPGRFAWKLQNIQPIQPIYCKGKQGLSVIRDPILLSAIDHQLVQHV